MKTCILYGLFASCIFAACTPAFAQPGRYRWEEVPAFVEGSSSRVGAALNNFGQVVGSQTGEIITTQSPHLFIDAGFLWEPGRLAKMLAPGAGLTTAARAISNSGVVVGYGWPQSGRYRAAVLSQAATPVFVPLDGMLSIAVGVNDSGAVIGNFSQSGVHFHAFRWDGQDAVIDLGTLGSLQSSAAAINSSGTIVGTSKLVSHEDRVFVVFAGGSMFDANSLLPQGSAWVLTHGKDVNDSGHIAGDGELNGQRRGFTFDPSAPEVVRELPPLSGHTYSRVARMNNRGCAAGTSVLEAGSVLDSTALVWKDGTAIDISTRVVNSIVSRYSSATDINDNGQVLVHGPSTGAGDLPNSIHRLTPLCDADFNADGFMSGVDFDEFVAAYEDGDPAADFDENTFVGSEDFDGFVEAFVYATGCP